MLINTVPCPDSITAPGGTKVSPILAACLTDLAERARDYGHRGGLRLAQGQILQQTWRADRHRYADWLNADCPQPGRSTAWAPRMLTLHVPEWGDDLAHGGWSAVIDFAAMRPRRTNGELWVADLEDWVCSFWRDLIAEAGLHLVSGTPHTTGFGLVIPAHLADADRPTIRALNGVAGAFGGGQHGARALALSWLMFDGLPVIDPCELSPRVREGLAELDVDPDAPPTLLLGCPAVVRAIGRHRDRLMGNRESYDGDA